MANLWAGGRIKLLNGLGKVDSKRASIQVQTDEEIYQLQLTSDYLINTAGAFSLDIDGSDFNTEFNIEDYSAGDFFSINRGWGIDLGARLRLNEKLTLAASIIDLGFISWKDNVGNFTSNGSFSFEGLDLDDIISDNSVELGGSADTIFETFNFTQTNEAFTTALASKIYLSGQYKVHSLFRAGALIYLENQRGKTFKALALNGTLTLGKIVSLGLVYSIHNRSFANVGLNTQVKLGPVQLFAASDNIVAVARPGNSRGTNARVGLNLAFGKRGLKIPILNKGE